MCTEKTKQQNNSLSPLLFVRKKMYFSTKLSNSNNLVFFLSQINSFLHKLETEIKCRNWKLVIAELWIIFRLLRKNCNLCIIDIWIDQEQDKCWSKKPNKQKTRLWDLFEFFEGGLCTYPNHFYLELIWIYFFNTEFSQVDKRMQAAWGPFVFFVPEKPIPWHFRNPHIDKAYYNRCTQSFKYQ